MRYRDYYPWYLPDRLYAKAVLEVGSYAEAVAATHGMGAEEVASRQAAVRALIPGVTYADPAHGGTDDDAVAVAFRNLRAEARALRRAPRAADMA